MNETFSKLILQKQPVNLNERVNFYETNVDKAFGTNFDVFTGKYMMKTPIPKLQKDKKKIVNKGGKIQAKVDFENTMKIIKKTLNNDEGAMRDFYNSRKLKTKSNLKLNKTRQSFEPVESRKESDRNVLVKDSSASVSNTSLHHSHSKLKSQFYKSEYFTPDISISRNKSKKLISNLPGLGSNKLAVLNGLKSSDQGKKPKSKFISANESDVSQVGDVKKCLNNEATYPKAFENDTKTVYSKFLSSSHGKTTKAKVIPLDLSPLETALQTWTNFDISSVNRAEKSPLNHEFHKKFCTTLLQSFKQEETEAKSIGKSLKKIKLKKKKFKQINKKNEVEDEIKNPSLIKKVDQIFFYNQGKYDLVLTDRQNKKPTNNKCKNYKLVNEGQKEKLYKLLNSHSIGHGILKKQILKSFKMT